MTTCSVLAGGLWPLVWVTMVLCATYLIARFWIARYEK
jgi:hypothetical protein